MNGKKKQLTEISINLSQLELVLEIAEDYADAHNLNKFDENAIEDIREAINLYRADCALAAKD